MKFTFTVWLLCLIATIASATPGRVFLVDSTPKDSPVTRHDVLPSTARLIFAQRLGLSGLYSIAGTDSAEIQHVDRYGGPAQFAIANRGSPRVTTRALILVDGVAKPEDLLRDSDYGFSGFDITPVPEPEQTERFLRELTDGLEIFKGRSFPSHPSLRKFNDLSGRHGNAEETRDGRTVIHVKGLTQTSQDYGDHSPQYREEVARVQSAIAEIGPADDLVLTLVFMPSKDSSKQSANSGWGHLHRRNARGQEAASERPLKAQNTSKSPVKQFPGLDVKDIPSRFSSQAACERTTQNCTGHGECKVLLTEMVADHKNEYYGCVCNKPEIRTNGDGSKKTTYFGGSACQKVDLTTPFWLLSGVTVFLVTIIALAIGMLHSMGDEELPSVIGAGVTGPKQR